MMNFLKMAMIYNIGVKGESMYLKPKISDLPQRAQRKVKINQGHKLLFSALLGSTAFDRLRPLAYRGELAEVCALVK